MEFKNRFGNEIRNYDDYPFEDGKLFILRDSLGISGIVRAHTWEEAYGICEDEFFPEADETVEDFVKEYGENWMDDERWQESYGFRPNGPNGTDTLNHGIYAKDLNGDYLDLLTLKLCAKLEFTVADTRIKA